LIDDRTLRAGTVQPEDVALLTECLLTAVDPWGEVSRRRRKLTGQVTLALGYERPGSGVPKKRANVK
jgi:hypothetical protein